MLGAAATTYTNTEVLSSVPRARDIVREKDILEAFLYD
jgi:hypothetical protein